jgi:hypothetical protein
VSVACAISGIGLAGTASASCIYNTGSGPEALAFGFSNTASGTGGYSSSALGVGQSQCWYGVGWSGGFVAITGSPTDLILAEYFAGIDVEPHGWIDVGVTNNAVDARDEACQYFVQPGDAHYRVFSRTEAVTGSGSNEMPVGTDCFGLTPVSE